MNHNRVPLSSLIRAQAPDYRVYISLDGERIVTTANNGADVKSFSVDFPDPLEDE